MSRRSCRQGSRTGTSAASLTAPLADGNPRLPSESSWSREGARPGVQRPEPGPRAARSCAILSRGFSAWSGLSPARGETALVVVLRTLTPGDLAGTETAVQCPPKALGSVPGAEWKARPSIPPKI